MSGEGASAAASAGGLAVLGAASAGGVPEMMGPGAQRAMGPGLVVGMPDAEIVDRLNAWGIARDGVVRDLADNLAQTQSVVQSTFEQARATLLNIVMDFRGEAETMRQHSILEATSSLGRLEHGVMEARRRFDAQELALIHL